MRNLILPLFLLLLPITLRAQEKDAASKTPEAKAKARTMEMTKDLGLSSAQSAQVEALWAVHYRRTAEIKATVNDEKMRKERLAKAKEMNRKALERVLTSEQFMRMVALETERKSAKKAAKAAKAAEGAPRTK